MVVYKGCIKNVLSRIYLEGVAYYGEPPQIYWDAKQALERLDNTCLTVNSNSDPNSPLGWRIKNYPILVVGKKNNKLKFSYTKKQLNNGDILIVVEEVADAYGNILTENKLKYLNNTMKTNKKVIRLTESDLHNMIEEAVKTTLNEAFGKEWNYGNDDEWDDENESLNTEYLEYLRKNNYSEDAIKKVANHMYANDCWVLKDGKTEVLCLANSQNGNLMYSLNQRGWRYVNK